MSDAGGRLIEVPLGARPRCGSDPLAPPKGRRFKDQWRTRRLGDLGTFSKGRGIKRTDLSETGVACVRYGELYTRYENYVIKPVSRIPQHVADDAWPIRTGDLLLAGSGETADEIGICVAYIGAESAYAGGDIIVLRALGQDAVYLAHLLNTPVATRQKARMAQGDAVVHIRSDHLAEVELSLPPLAEQHAIAAVLADVDELIGSLEALIAKKRAIKQAAMQELLTGRTRLPGFGGEWQTRPISELTDVDPENLLSTTDPSFRFNYISLDHVELGRLRGYSRQEFGTAPSRARRVVRPGDVLMSTVRPALRGHLLYRGQVTNAICSTGFAVLRANRDLCEPEFLFAHLFGDLVTAQLQRLLAGSNYPAINSSEVGGLRVACPPTLEEQRAIATVLSDMDSEIAALERRLDKTRALKQGTMQQLLTGSIRLPIPETAPEDESSR